MHYLQNVSAKTYLCLFVVFDVADAINSDETPTSEEERKHDWQEKVIKCRLERLRWSK